MYHGIVDQPLAVFNWCQLPTAEFEEQIRFLSERYHVLPLMELVDRMEAGYAVPDNAVALTFDDGFRNVYTTAHPILLRHGMPYTVFLVTGQVGTRQPAWPDQLYLMIAETKQERLRYGGREWSLADSGQRASAYRRISARLKGLRPGALAVDLDEIRGRLGVAPVGETCPLATLNWDEVEELAQTGLASFGSHSHSHAILSLWDGKAQEEELRVSRDLVREHVGAVDAFAYPNGRRRDFTETTKRLLLDLGYRCGLTTIPGLNGRRVDPFELRRVNVGADTDLAQFQLRMLGL